MSRLDQEPDVIEQARKLGVIGCGDPVQAVVGYCLDRILRWARADGPVSTIGELEAVVARRLRMVFEEVETDEALDALIRKYVKLGEGVFAYLKHDFDAETFGATYRRGTVPPDAPDRLVAIIDCRGEKGARRFFTRWHEVAHFLAEPEGEEVETPVRRASDSPLERLMDEIAAHAGFYEPIFGPGGAGGAQRRRPEVEAVHRPEHAYPGLVGHLPTLRRRVRVRGRRAGEPAYLGALRGEAAGGSGSLDRGEESQGPGGRDRPARGDRTGRVTRSRSISGSEPSMNDALFERLLYEEESTTLDFKKEQYRFVKAGEEEKSELLKDILGFANAWRRSEAYILIGVEDVRGGRGNVVGISGTDHLDDHALQQFVNNLTNRPVRFHYEAFGFEAKQVGIIRIEEGQARPLYLKTNYGKLKKTEVYVRRGSSTDPTKPAGPDELALMGQGVGPQDAELVVEFADVARDEPLTDDAGARSGSADFRKKIIGQEHSSHKCRTAGCLSEPRHRRTGRACNGR
jgi:hypothetical protein